MKYVINHDLVLSRAPEGPLAAYLDAFARSLSAQGYTQHSVHRQVLLAADLSRWLGRQGVRSRRVTSDHPARYLRHRARRTRLRQGDAAALEHFIAFLRRESVIPAKKQSAPRLTAAERCAQAYEQYLREARALATATLVNYLRFVRLFLEDRFGDGRVTLSRLRADDVIGFVQREVPRLSRRRAKLMTTALRSFLRYVRYRGETKVDLAAAVPVVPNWSMSSIPRAIPADQVRQLLASIDRGTTMGRRDYAILLLLARLGLRASEVAFLELDDIDWNVGRLTVRGKSGQRHDLPLPAEVGRAIAAYLRRGRPTSTSRRVFLRTRAPIRGFRGPIAVCSVVRHALERAGIRAPNCGAHQFRHGLATQMLRGGASLDEIGELLGHRHPQTTKIYTHVNVQALRSLALPWPGGAR
jgi:integrase/recombinase XerD